MKLLLATLALLLCLGCASLPHTPDGSLNVPILLTWAQDGLNVGCSDTWVPADACKFGTDALNTAQAIAAKNPPDIRAAVKQSLIDSLAKVPATSRVRVYIQWVVDIL